MRASSAPTARRSSRERGSTLRSHEAPLVLERYRLRQCLGAGGFGTVWMAIDERLEREVAVKIFPGERINGGRFEREAKAAARLSHPGIVTLYEAGVDDKGAYLVSELVHGATLEQLLAAGKLSDRDIVQAGVALCDALAHAHAHAIVHRDLKPSNVLIPADPAPPLQTAKLTDFGVARIVGAESLTRGGEVIGTAAYMAPEQADGLVAGASADLYSLAVVIYEALTGVNPVRTSSSQRGRRLGAHLPPLRRQRRELPRELGHGIDLALRPRPAERGTLEELRAALVVSLQAVGEEPGVVTSAWPALTLARLSTQASDVADRPEQTLEETRRQEGPAAPTQALAGVPWPRRAAAAAAGAGLLAWVDARLLAAPLPPAVAAVIGALAMAALPRLAWVGLIALSAATMAVQGHLGGILVLLIAAAIPVLARPHDPAGWPLPVAAPALAVVGLGGVWPALAALSGSAWRRAALGATGWVWLLIACSFSGRALYVKPPRGLPAPEVWMSSMHAASRYVWTSTFTARMLAPALVWGAAAAVLPRITQGRSPTRAVALASTWSVTVTAVTTIFVAGRVAPSAIILGTVGGAFVALLPVAGKSLTASRRQRRDSDNTAPELP